MRVLASVKQFRKYISDTIISVIREELKILWFPNGWFTAEIVASSGGPATIFDTFVHILFIINSQCRPWWFRGALGDSRISTNKRQAEDMGGEKTLSWEGPLGSCCITRRRQRLEWCSHKPSGLGKAAVSSGMKLVPNSLPRNSTRVAWMRASWVAQW